MSQNEDCQVNEHRVIENLKYEASTLENKTMSNISGMKCIGILPGLGSYEDSSDSDCSSDTDQEPEPNRSKYDLLGRKIEEIEKEETLKQKS